MLTQERIKELVDEELTVAQVVVLLRCSNRKPSGKGPEVEESLRELGLMDQKSWSCTEDGRDVIRELKGFPYEPGPAYIAGVPASELERTPASKLRARHAPEGDLYDKFRPGGMPTSGSPDGRHRRLAEEGSGRVETIRATICVKCGEHVPKGATVVWVKDYGVFHPDCAPPS